MRDAVAPHKSLVNPAEPIINGIAFQNTGSAQNVFYLDDIELVPNCVYSIPPGGRQFSASGGNDTVAVTANAGCAWTAFSNRPSWLSVVSGASGSGNGTVALTVAANATAASRTAALWVGGQTLTVTQGSAPSFTTHPANQTVVPGEAASFTASATGSPSPALQWQRSTNGGSSWTDLTDVAPYSGTTTPTMTISNTSASLTGTHYRMVATNASGSATSNMAMLVVATATEDSRMAFGLTPIGGDGGWMAVRSGRTAGFNAKPWTRLPWPSYNASGKGLHLAAGDVDGDSVDELIAGVESGGNGWIAVLDDAAHGHALLQWIQVPWIAYNAANGEVWPAAGDIDNDGRAEIVAGLGSGAAGWFAIFDDSAGAFALIGWRRVSWPTYNAGDGRTYPAIGNVDASAGAEIILGLGPGSNGWIEIFGSSASGYAHRSWIQVPWQTYNAMNGETHVAAGDLDGDCLAEIVAGLGAGGRGWLHIFDDANALHASVARRRTSWAAYNADGARGQIYPAVGDVDGDRFAEIVLGLGPYPDVGGWFEVLDDGSAGNAGLGWRNVGWPSFTAAGGGLYPAVGRFEPATLMNNWSIAQSGSVLQIGYASGASVPQYAALHTESGYFRMNPPGSNWGTSTLIVPSFWTGGALHQGSCTSVTWRTEGADLVLSFTSAVSTLTAHGEVRMQPPGTNSLTATVSVAVDGSVVLDNRPGEAFKPVFFSSMHVAPDVWDTSAAFVGAQTFAIPQEGWIVQPPATGSVFGLRGGTSTWKTNAPTMEVTMDRNLAVTGWVTRSSDPNDDNVGFWNAATGVLRAWQYVLMAIRP